jgi:DNA-directed RNA polymerase specialized sigma24 family protein
VRTRIRRRRRRRRRRRVCDNGDNDDDDDDDDDDKDYNKINTALLMSERSLWNCETNTYLLTTETSTSRQSLNFVLVLEMKVS